MILLLHHLPVFCPILSNRQSATFDVLKFSMMATLKEHKQRKWINMVYFYFLCLCPLRYFTALFTNTRILRLKRQLTIAFFAAVNHLNGPLRKQNFTLTGSKGHGLWFVISGFRSILCVSVFQGSLLVIVITIDGSENRNCEGGFWT